MKFGVCNLEPSIQRLQLLELIEENGRLDAPGRPISLRYN